MEGNLRARPQTLHAHLFVMGQWVRTERDLSTTQRMPGDVSGEYSVSKKQVLVDPG